jgi:hypothetical protein
MAATSAEERLERLYDDAAGFVEAGMPWEVYWSSTRLTRDRFADALHRRAERQRQEAERGRRRR